MKILALAIFLVSLICISAAAYAQATQLKFDILPKNVTEGAPFIWVLETPTLLDPARVSWILLGNDAAGGFVKVGPNKWACFFSLDKSATCGIQPFAIGGTLTTRVYVSSPQTITSQEFVFSTGNAKVRGDSLVTGNNLLAWVVVTDF